MQLNAWSKIEFHFLLKIGFCVRRLRASQVGSLGKDVLSVSQVFGRCTCVISLSLLFFLFFPLFLVPVYYLRAFSFSFSLTGRNSDPGSLSRLICPPPQYGTCLRFYREEKSALSSLVDSRRAVLAYAIKVSLEYKNVPTCWSLWKTKMSLPEFEPLTPALVVYTRLTTRPPGRPAPGTW